MSRWLMVILVMVAAGIAGSLPLRAPSAARDTSEEIVVRLAVDGAVTVWVGPDSHHLREVSLRASRSGDGDAEITRDTITALQPVLDELAGRIERDEYGVSRARMRIEAAPRARSLWLLWVMGMGVVPTTDISQYAFSTRGAEETLEMELPRDGQLESAPLFHDLFVRMVQAAEGPADEVQLSLDELGRSVVDDVFSNGGVLNPVTVAGPFACSLDARATPTGLEPLVAAARQARARDPRDGDLWLLIALPRARAGVDVAARTLLDMFGALQQIEGLRVEFGIDLFPRTFGEPGGR